MTCEVIVMNQRGIALAADSAVTLGDGRKIYHSAEKLFPLGASSSVGIMTYGNADFMGMPWELIIKAYAQKLGDGKFGKLEQYAGDFLAFVETNDAFFPEAVQQAYFRSVVAYYWEIQLADRLREAANPKKTLLGLLRNERAAWEHHELVEDSSFGERVLAEYPEVLEDLETQMFGELDLSTNGRQQLRATVKELYTRAWPEPWESGIVVAGLGELEPFPSYLAYNVGTIAAGKLRYAKVGEATINRESQACVAPFAQRNMIDLFYCGIHPNFKDTVFEIITHALERVLPQNARRARQVDAIMSLVSEALETEISENYNQPLIDAVGALPRHELAKMAEALVSLTKFRKRSSADEMETVAGPIDVALISKGEGFVWIKQKGRVEGDATAF